MLFSVFVYHPVSNDAGACQAFFVNTSPQARRRAPFFGRVFFFAIVGVGRGVTDLDEATNAKHSATVQSATQGL
jgi:hypothetical protein